MFDIFPNQEIGKPKEFNAQLTLEEKIQKLINLCTSYKEKYDSLQANYERVMTSSIEYEEERTQIVAEKAHLEQKVDQLSEELLQKEAEIELLKEKNSEYESITKTAVSKIDKLLQECEDDI